MKKIIPFLIYPNAFKIAGAILAGAGILLFLFYKDDFQLLLYFGLFTMAISKEKKENELTEFSRNQAFKATFSYIFSVYMAVFLAGVISEGIEFPVSSLFLLGFPFLFYLLYFNILMILNASSVKEEGKSVRNKCIQWIVFLVVIIGLLCIKFLL